MLRLLAFRDLIGRLVRTWIFWFMFIALAAVRIYLDTVLTDTVDYRGRIIWSFFVALVVAWANEGMTKDAPPAG